ncbi:11679_t:CDS:2 [Rhizophagus irregularis]|nr:11679_t:CDS:2 [Rhizophagus irregularis]
MYTIDPTRINQLANDHYQNIVLSIYLTAQITIEELNATLKTLPNNKAPEPSGIVYELIRKLPSSFHKKLTVFYNYILDNGIIPSSWQDALLYPIPKPAWWDNNIQHTRPIVLLDTFQKVFVKIINARLNKYLSENSILQSNNLAGTQARLILHSSRPTFGSNVPQNGKFGNLVTALQRINLKTRPPPSLRNRRNPLLSITRTRSADLMFIIFSSSNFLHSGTFFQHMDFSLSQDVHTSHINTRHAWSES